MRERREGRQRSRHREDKEGEHREGKEEGAGRV